MSNKYLRIYINIIEIHIIILFFLNIYLVINNNKILYTIKSQKLMKNFFKQ